MKLLLLLLLLSYHLESSQICGVASCTLRKKTIADPRNLRDNSPYIMNRCNDNNIAPSTYNGTPAIGKTDKTAILTRFD